VLCVVKEDFLSKYRDQVGLIEKEVIKEHLNYLTRSCREEKFMGQHGGKVLVISCQVLCHKMCRDTVDYCVSANLPYFHINENPLHIW